MPVGEDIPENGVSGVHAVQDHDHHVTDGVEEDGKLQRLRREGRGGEGRGGEGRGGEGREGRGGEERSKQTYKLTITYYLS